jgi:hypothetical protein
MAKTVRHHHMAAQQGLQQPQQDANAGWNNNGWNNNGWNNNDWNDERRDSGFWPADVAAGAVGTAAGIAGAAVGTAGAIATSPFRTADAYAYDNRYAAASAPPPIALERAAPYDDRGQNGYYGNWDNFATRNGIACRPGTMFKGADGLAHPCQ